MRSEKSSLIFTYINKSNPMYYLEARLLTKDTLGETFIDMYISKNVIYIFITVLSRVL